MVKLIIFFRQPADVQAFEDHFAHRHVPLIAAMPNVIRTSVSRTLGAPRGASPYYLVHDVYFADMAALNYALNSAQGRAAGADLMAFARDIVSLMFAEVWGEDPFEAGPSAKAAPEPPQQKDAEAAQAEAISPATGDAPIRVVEEHPNITPGDPPATNPPSDIPAAEGDHPHPPQLAAAERPA